MNSHVETHRKARHLSQVFTARDSQDGAGVKLKRVFAFQAVDGSESLDPFLLLDEFASDDAADYIGGFPDHPHRGFETVTYMLAGCMEHRDHMGNRGLLEPGSVQWMSAAHGVIHSEMPKQEEGRMQGFQLWVNLPAAEKMKAPGYQEFSPQEIPSYTLGHGATVKAIAGKMVIDDQVIQGPVTGISTTPIYLDISLPPVSRLSIPVPAGHTVLTHIFEGVMYAHEGVDERSQALTPGQMGKWSDGDHVQLSTGKKGVRLLLLAAQPLNEPVVHYGPFVMNTRDEIEQALHDYRTGKLTEFKGE